MQLKEAPKAEVVSDAGLEVEDELEPGTSSYDDDLLDDRGYTEVVHPLHTPWPCA